LDILDRKKRLSLRIYTYICFYKLNKQNVISDTIYANDAIIAKEEVFVYNLGTMYYINKVLFVNRDQLPPVPPKTTTTGQTIPPLNFTTPSLPDDVETVPSTLGNRPTEGLLPDDVEKIPEELEVDVGDFPDVLLQDDSDAGATTLAMEETAGVTESSLA